VLCEITLNKKAEEIIKFAFGIISQCCPYVAESKNSLARFNDVLEEILEVFLLDVQSELFGAITAVDHGSYAFHFLAKITASYFEYVLIKFREKGSDSFTPLRFNLEINEMQFRTHEDDANVGKLMRLWVRHEPYDCVVTNQFIVHVYVTNLCRH